MTTLLLAKHDNHALNDATSKALTAAKALGAPVHVLVAGTGCRGVAEAAAKLDGVEKVLVADDPAYEHRLAEPPAALIVSLAQLYDHLVAPGTTTGKNVMPRVAALLDVMQVSDIIKVVGPDTFERPIYAGNAIQTVQAIDPKKVITVRTAAFQPVGEGTQAAPIEEVPAGPNPNVSIYSAARSCPNRIDQSWLPQRLSSPVVARLARRRTSKRTSSRLLTGSALPLALRARQWTPATPRTIGRAVRPARWWRLICTLRSASRARSSIWPA